MPRGGRRRDPTPEPAPTPEPTPDPTPGDCTGVPVPAGADLQALINGQAEGTTFCLDAGIYTPTAPLVPKARQRFVSLVPRAAIITGRDVLPVGFNGAGKTGVELHGLVVEHCATPDQGGQAAVRLGPFGVFNNGEVRNNRYVGIYHEADTQILHSVFSYNGVRGITGYKAHRAKIQHCQVHHNGARAVAGESGGTKWTLCDDLHLADTWGWDNTSNGFWFDGGNIRYLVERLVSKTSGRGIHLEVGCTGTIQDSEFHGNQNTAIEIVCARGQKIVRNKLVDNANGIRAQHQPIRASTTGSAGSGFSFVNVPCPWETIECEAWENEIYQSVGTVASIIRYPRDDRVPFAETFQTDPFRCLWRNNRYYLRNLARPFGWADTTKTFAEWQALGQDVGSTVGAY